MTHASYCSIKLVGSIQDRASMYFDFRLHTNVARRKKLIERLYKRNDYTKPNDMEHDPIKKKGWGI